jgi:ribose/xylose/arabinose/galactoside ABC-type transport system permease subunit
VCGSRSVVRGLGSDRIGSDRIGVGSGRVGSGRGFEVALVSVVLLGTVESGLVLLDVDPTTVQMINGVILLFAIYLYNTQERLRRRLLTE